MVDRIGNGAGLQREAILAALRSQAKSAEEVRGAADAVAGPSAAPNEAAEAQASFSKTLVEGLRGVDQEIRSAETLPEDVLTGRVQDFHEIATRIKRADLSFKYALEVRNKLIDAYREVMRMSV